MHVDQYPAAITQLALHPDVVVGNAFIGIKLRHSCGVDSVYLAVDGLIAGPKHRIALCASQLHALKPAISLALSPRQQMMGGSA